MTTKGAEFASKQYYALIICPGSFKGAVFS